MMDGWRLPSMRCEVKPPPGRRHLKNGAVAAFNARNALSCALKIVVY
jgi:hypothetical protein